MTVTSPALPGTNAWGAPTRHVEHCMGTVFSFDIRGAGVPSEALEDAVRWLHHVDATFSTYRPDSVICRLNRGELTIPECSEEVREVLALAGEAAGATRGYFTDSPHGLLDPTGVVKGWAIERASDLLRAAGSTSHSVNGGGDVQLVGSAAEGRPWRVGIAHPLRPRQLVAVVAASDAAVATSGTAERGRHIIDPHTGDAVDELASVTLIGAGLAWVDACATAVFAMGLERGLDWVEHQEGLAALAVMPSGQTHWTRDFPRWGSVL